MMNEIFNYELKKKYIDSQKGRNVTLEEKMISIFCISYPLEEKYGDISTFTVKQIFEFYKYYNSRSILQLHNINCQLRMYADWCILNKEVQSDGQNHYAEITVKELSTCVNTAKTENIIISSEDIESICNELINPFEKFIVSALFDGIMGDYCTELTEVRMKDFINDNGVWKVKLNTGRCIPVSNNTYVYARESALSYSYSTITGKEVKFKEDDDRCVKNKWNTYGEENKLKRRKVIYNTLVAISDLVGKQLTVLGLIESGRIEKIREYMKQDQDNNIEDVIKRHEDIEYVYGKIFQLPIWESTYGKYVAP